jgi:Mn2+/Fe2+ NRAMP family transporter
MSNLQQQRKPNKSTTDAMRYVGWGTQMFVLLGLAVFGGSKIDKALKFSTPLLVWILPFVVLVVMIYQLIKETSKRNTDNDQKKI